MKNEVIFTSFSLFDFFVFVFICYLKETWNAIAIDKINGVGMCNLFLPFFSKKEINKIWGLFVISMPMCIKQLWNLEKIKSANIYFGSWNLTIPLLCII